MTKKSNLTQVKKELKDFVAEKDLYSVSISRNNEEYRFKEKGYSRSNFTITLEEKQGFLAIDASIEFFDSEINRILKYLFTSFLDDYVKHYNIDVIFFSTASYYVFEKINELLPLPNIIKRTPSKENYVLESIFKTFFLNKNLSHSSFLGENLFDNKWIYHTSYKILDQEKVNTKINLLKKTSKVLTNIDKEDPSFSILGKVNSEDKEVIDLNKNCLMRFYSNSYNNFLQLKSDNNGFCLVFNYVKGKKIEKEEFSMNKKTTEQEISEFIKSVIYKLECSVKIKSVFNPPTYFFDKFFSEHLSKVHHDYKPLLLDKLHSLYGFKETEDLCSELCKKISEKGYLFQVIKKRGATINDKFIFIKLFEHYFVLCENEVTVFPINEAEKAHNFYKKSFYDHLEKNLNNELNELENIIYN